MAGQDYCIIAADSRLSDGYTILSRNVSRVHRLSGDTHLATAGCWADTQGLLRLLGVRRLYAISRTHCVAFEQLLGRCPLSPLRPVIAAVADDGRTQRLMLARSAC